MKKFLLGLALLTLFAWLLREYFIAVTVVEIPIRGDIRQYVAYAWNLLDNGTFSHVWPGSGTPVPDTFRGPGYPVFLAALMWLDPQGWYALGLHAQAVVGALTATLTVLLARHWLPDAWAFVAGALVAVWPHHVAATGALLTEVVFGFLLMLALWLSAEAMKRRSVGWAAGAGVAFSTAALTSMISLLFPVFAGLVLWRTALPRAALVLVALSLLGPAAWSVRNATVDHPQGQAGRMTMNLVQGSWPQYHAAFRSQNSSPVGKSILRAIDEEVQLLASTPRSGLRHMGARMARDPAYYLRWYVLEKPYLLWDWDIRVGAGDIYFLEVGHSPFTTQPALRMIRAGLKMANPLIFALSASASLVLLIGWIRNRPWTETAATLVAAFCVYVTLVHWVFQAEPRYSIPYRPMQVLMLATALTWLGDRIRRLRRDD